ncbi:MAG: T9SS type A sorting domain-containing protein [bacterium]|nr:T9SS type A sorting domain-containing protein [bacterium]
MKKEKQILSRIFFILLLLFAAVRQTDAQESTYTESQGSLITPQFFGIDPYGGKDPGWPQFFELLNEDSLNFGLVGFGIGWERIEPAPPQGGVHSYDWSSLDERMQIVVKSGRMADLDILCRSDWATVVPSSQIERPLGMSPPKEDANSDTTWGMTAYQAWSDFVFNLVERYDSDGIDDAPGITRPALRYLHLGNEPEAPDHFLAYGGSPELYDRMLAVTYEAAKRANPNILVVRGRSNPGNIFDDNPDEVTLRARSGDYLDFLTTSLRLGSEHFDVFAINFNDHYTGLFPFVRWLKTEMAKNGYTKPLLVAAARTTLCPRDNDAPVHILPPRYPPGFMESLRDTSHPQHIANRTLYHADEVRQSLRKMVVALASGQEAISLQPGIGPVIHPRAIWRDAGLIDAQVYRATGDLRKARKPVYYAARQLMDVLIGADKQVKILDLGADVFAYQITKQGKNFFLLWHEDPFDVDSQGLVRRGQKVAVDLTPFVSTPQVRVKYFVIELDSNYAPIYPSDVIVSANGVVIDETPLLVESLNPTSVEDKRENIPQRFLLYQNYPNPFNPQTTICFHLLRREHVTLKVFDVLGREVATLVDGEVNAGDHAVLFYAKDLPSGIYFYRLTTRSFSQTKLMEVAKL